MRHITLLAVGLTACLVTSCATTTHETNGGIVNREVAPPQTTDPLEAGLQQLADQIVSGLRTQKAKEIAVLQFQNLDGSVTEFGGFIAEELITRLYKTGSFQVMERELLNRVMAEHELEISGLVDESTAKELGKLLGVDAIATGTITDLGSQVRVNSRLIATETGSVFSAAAVSLPKDSRVKILMDKYLTLNSGKTSTKFDGDKSNTERGASDLISPEPGLIAEYYNVPPNTQDFPSGSPIFKRVEARINYNWGRGSAIPRAGVDWFAIRWSGYIAIDAPGVYTFKFSHDDGLRVWIGSQKIYDCWLRWTASSAPVDVEFEKSGWLPFRAEYIEFAGDARCIIQWAPPGVADFEIVSDKHFGHD